MEFRPIGSIIEPAESKECPWLCSLALVLAFAPVVQGGDVPGKSAAQLSVLSDVRRKTAWTESPLLSQDSPGQADSPGDQEFLHRLGFRYENWEFDEISFQHTFPVSLIFFSSEVEVETDVEDVDRDLFKLEYEGGKGAARWHASVFSERMKIDGPVVSNGPEFRYVDDLDLHGVELGVRGKFPILKDWPADLFGVFGVSGSYHRGSGDDLIDEISYFELRTRLGAGFGFSGFEISGGGFGSGLCSDFDLEISGVSGDEFEADVVAGFAQVGWTSEKTRTHVEVEAFFGQAQGIVGALQFRF